MMGSRMWCALLCAIVLAGAFQAQAQVPATPFINPPNASPPGLQSGFFSSSPTPTLPAAITIDTNQGSFYLFINGRFNPNAFDTVTWFNPTAQQTMMISASSVTATQVQVLIPSSLYQGFVVTVPEAVTITLTENVSGVQSSATATYTINPGLSFPPTAFPPATEGGLILPLGTVGVPYSQPVALNGTGPFTASLQGGTVPAGLSLPSNSAPDNLTGTPTAAGVSEWVVTVTDVWNNQITIGEATEIVSPATISSLAPASVPAGTPNPINVNGANFVNVQGLNEGTIPGSTAGVASGSSFVPLSTTFVSGNQLMASVSTFAPGNYNIEVQQPTGGLSNTRPLTVVGPTITSLSPGSGAITARTTPFTVTVNGANFVANMALSPVNSIVVSNPQGTIFVNGNTLTLTQVFSAGVLPIQVQNPGGALSNIVNLTVLPPPTITALSPPTATAGNPQFSTLLVSGTNFTNTMQVILGESPVTTSFINATTLSAAVPLSMIGLPTNIPVTVVTADGYFTPSVTLPVLPQPTVTSISPTAAAIGSSPALTVTGTNFTNTMQIAFGGTLLTTRFNSATSLSATIPANLTANSGNIGVTVVTVDHFSTASVPFIVYGPLTITSILLPTAANGQPYSAALTASGGVPPYTWSGTSLQGLTLNSRTGVLSGTVTTTSSFTIVATVTDSIGTTVTTTVSIPMVNPNPPVTITTGNSLPVGTVGVPYSASITAGGGSGSFSFAVEVGSLPPGLSMAANGGITGTPTAAGTFNFTVRATDSAGNVGTGGFSIQIKPAALTITGPASPINLNVGDPVSIQFGATGGVQPYAFNVTGNLPDGTTFSRTALLSGKAATAGTYAFTVVVTDATALQVTKSFTINVATPQLTLNGSLGNGQVGVAYSANISASGGQPPYTFTVTGLPDGLSYGNGSVTGTPTTAGTFTVGVSVTDSAGTKASATSNVTIASAGLTVSGSLPNGAVGTAYSASVGATGGVPPYSFSIGGLPAGLSGSSNGSITGTPTTAGANTVSVTVTDSKGTTASKTFQVTISGPLPLVITSASVPNMTVGTAVSANCSASGGVPPYTWSASNLPAGLSITAVGANISGTPTTPGSGSFTVTVKDSAGNTASASVSYTIALPSAPPVNLNGLPPTSNPATQSTLQIGIGTAYPVDVTVTLTLTFAPDSGQDDPNVQFSTGGRTATLTIPAGSLNAANTVGVQTGTVAGTVTITTKLVAATVDITPTPVPTRTIRINAAVPTATTVTATISGTGFTVTVVGFDTTRSISSAIFTFTAAAGANLQTTSVTIPVSSIFSAWYGSSASAQYGSQFTFTQPFNVQGGVNAVASVTVVLVNSVGSSSPASATLH